jgi:hypothetical protein
LSEPPLTNRPVGQQHGVEVHPSEAERRPLDVGRVRVGQVDDVGPLGRMGLVRLALGTATDDHHALVLGRPEQHARRLVAPLDVDEVRHRRRRDRVVVQVQDAGPDLGAVVHPAAGEEHAAVGHEEQVRVERQSPTVDVHRVLPLLQHGVVDLQDTLGPHTAARIEPGAGQYPPGAECDERRVPAGVRHRGGERPDPVLVEVGGPSGRMPVVCRPPTQPAVGQERVAAAEQVERAVVGGEGGRRLTKVSSGGLRRR